MPAIKHWWENHARFKPHLAPTSASWLNALYRVFTSVAELEAAIRKFIEAHNDLFG